MEAYTVKRAHRTWAGTFWCWPQKYLQPRNIEEIQQTIVNAHKQGKTLMATGAGHSASNITMTNEWVVNLDRFNKIVDIKRDPSGRFADVTVEAGARIYELNEQLAKEGLAIQNLGSISDQSVAGIISTGTHGSSAYHGLVSQQIVDLTLAVGPKGELVKCSETENSDLFAGALLSLGKLGLIVYATLRVVPAFDLAWREELMPFAEFRRRLGPQLWTSAEYMRVWWYPYADKCLVWAADRTGQSAADATEGAPTHTPFFSSTVGRVVYEGLLWLAVKVAPRLTGWIERMFVNTMFAPVGEVVTGVARSDKAMNMDCRFSQFVNEWAVPMSEAPAVLDELHAVLRDATTSGAYYVHSPFEVRLLNSTRRASDVPQSSTGRGPIPGNAIRPLLDYTPDLPYAEPDSVSTEQLTLVLNATMFRPFGFNCVYDDWYATFEGIMLAHGGRPHWAKNFLGPDKAVSKTGAARGLRSVIADWYGSRLDQYRALRQQYDPDGIFLSGVDWARAAGIID